jgi:uncharacterized protein YnzC (UPF0291/DUF896 family)
LHREKTKLQAESITKVSGLFGNAKQKSMNAITKKDLREAYLSTLKCVKKILKQLEIIDTQIPVTDAALQALWFKHRAHEHRHIFVMSPMWPKN